MKHTFILLVSSFIIINSVSAQRIEFEYNEFGERVLQKSVLYYDKADNDSDTKSLIKEKKVISLYPNPVSDFLEINFKDGIYEVVLTDFTGKRICQYKDVTNNLVVDFSDCASGVYFIKVSDKIDGEIYKIVKK
ncbi:MAG: T9SS type A sorting domain-containing protein [Bacteroidales bacterium]|nr:T9SS type A sorting domain-containing protein [Bacteroidales bacterium]